MAIKLLEDILLGKHYTDARSSLEGKQNTWNWVAGQSLLGSLELEGSQLTLTTHSESRADRGRQLIERIAEDAVAYRSSERVDMLREVEKSIQSGGQGSAVPGVHGQTQPAMVRRPDTLAPIVKLVIVGDNCMHDI
jgi:hypothetical protein